VTANQFNVSQFKLTTASILMLVGGALILVGWVMPWVTVSANLDSLGLGGLGSLGANTSYSASGSSVSLGIVALLCAVAAAGAGAAFAYMKPRYHMAWMVAAGAGAVALLVMLVNWGDISNGAAAVSSMSGGLGNLLGIDFSEYIKVSVGIGFWLTGVGALVALAGAYLGYMEAKATAMPAAMPPAATAA
jgi:hypothetical protein